MNCLRWVCTVFALTKTSSLVETIFSYFWPVWTIFSPFLSQYIFAFLFPCKRICVSLKRYLFKQCMVTLTHAQPRTCSNVAPLPPTRAKWSSVVAEYTEVSFGAPACVCHFVITYACSVIFYLFCEASTSQPEPAVIPYFDNIIRNLCTSRGISNAPLCPLQDEGVVCNALLICVSTVV